MSPMAAHGTSNGFKLADGDGEMNGLLTKQYTQPNREDLAILLPSNYGDAAELAGEDTGPHAVRQRNSG